MKRTPLKRSTKQMKRTKLRVAGHSTSTELKKEIQAMLRQIVMARDGGCIFRHYENDIVPQYKYCGGFKKSGELILQAEHLNSRSNMISFADSRLAICICPRHHLFYKPQFSDEFYRIARRHIGKERSDLLTRVQEDRSPHKVDLKLELLALTQEYKKLL